MVNLFLKYGCIVWLSFFVYTSIHSQNVGVDSICTKTGLSFVEKLAQFGEESLNKVSWRKGRHQVSVFPVGGYSERTRFECGAMVIWQMEPKSENKSKYYRPATFTPSFQISTSGMKELSCDFSIYTSNLWMIQSESKYHTLDDRFFGYGNDFKDKSLFSYHRQELSIEGNVVKGITKNFFGGIGFDLCYESNRPNDSLYFDSTIIGKKGGWLGGLGPTLLFDSRNNINYPSKGIYARASVLFYSEAIFGKYNFRNLSVDIRKFLPFDKKMDYILAMQMLMNFTDGEVPFYRKSMLGGKKSVRSIGHTQKYMGSHIGIIQSEFRGHLWWRIGATVFGGVGNVFESNNDVLDNLHWFAGGGLRFSPLNDVKLNVRIDYGRTSRSDSGLFITIGEAF
ncbi:MAG: BamA/TamA family outer membrane protein [Marinilabiliaceae bacterium]|nr:BamA/TamA family outer membrane protein [Marinilabiliaceae bacterium]